MNREKWKILIVDDSEEDRAEVRRLLLSGSERRYQFIEEGMGEAAVRACEGPPHDLPDCLVLDYHLPDMDARDVLAAVSGGGRFPPCPIVVVTGGAAASGPALLRAGAQDYIGKNWLTPESLTRAVENAIERFSLLNERQRAQREIAEAQERLAEYATALERTVAERTAQLRDTVKELESFSYTVSHDLKAPLRAIGGYVDALLEDCDGNLGHEALDYLRRIAGSARRMELLIKDLLEYTRLSFSPHHLGPVRIEAVLAHVLEFNPSLRDQADLIVQGPLLPVCGNETRLAQAVGNLISNAVKFVPSGVRPRIVIRTESVRGPLPGGARGTSREPAPRPSPGAVHPPEPPTPLAARTVQDLREPASPPSRVRLWVEDNGVGIDPADHQKVFAIFERLRGSSSREGMGIGLAIVAKVAERMGGTCGVESALGEGSRFWVELPAASAGRGDYEN